MSMLGWCSSGKHKDCPGSYEPFYFSGNKIVYREDKDGNRIVVKCECPKRGCKCYVKRTDRTKKPKPRKRVAKK